MWFCFGCGQTQQTERPPCPCDPAEAAMWLEYASGDFYFEALPANMARVDLKNQVGEFRSDDPLHSVKRFSLKNPWAET